MPHTRAGSRRFLPASVLALRHYTPHLFVSDLIAGVTVGLVALPLAMAFAISSGMSPQAGIYCAVVTGFIISALGGSYVQIGGPTGAFVVVVSGIIAQYGVDGLFMCTMMAGVVLVIMGVTGGGSGGFLLFWKPDADKDYHRFQLPNLARDMDVHPDGLQVATAHYDRNVRITRLAAKTA